MHSINDHLLLSWPVPVCATLMVSIDVMPLRDLAKLWAKMCLGSAADTVLLEQARSDWKNFVLHQRHLGIKSPRRHITTARQGEAVWDTLHRVFHTIITPSSKLDLHLNSRYCWWAILNHLKPVQWYWKTVTQTWRPTNQLHLCQKHIWTYQDQADNHRDHLLYRFHWALLQCSRSDTTKNHRSNHCNILS